VHNFWTGAPQAPAASLKKKHIEKIKETQNIYVRIKKMPTYKSIFSVLCSSLLTAYFMAKQEGKLLENTKSEGKKNENAKQRK